MQLWDVKYRKGLKSVSAKYTKQRPSDNTSSFKWKAGILGLMVTVNFAPVTFANSAPKDATREVLQLVCHTFTFAPKRGSRSVRLCC